MRKLFAIFGNPINHSRSPLMHNSVFNSLKIDACYSRVHLENGEKLRETFFNLKLSGANVTVPHKEVAYLAADEVRGIARKIGAVNTLVAENGKLIGYNTDASGFYKAIEPYGKIETVLIVGAGGTAKALAHIFSENGISATVLNRSKKRLASFEELGLKTFTWSSFPNENLTYNLIINTTSAGLVDSELPAPLNLIEPLLKEATFAVDVIYGKDTPFIKLANKHRCKTQDGTNMLLYQGVLANELFTNGKYDYRLIESAMRGSFRL